MSEKSAARADRLAALQQTQQTQPTQQMQPEAARTAAPPQEIRRLAVAFRRAAVSLAVDAPDAGTAGTAGHRAGGLLVSLAGAGGDQALADILRADPAGADATWTVACYQIGDLSPSSLRDFSSAADAVRCISDCGTAAHVAAELIVTNGDGVRWTAMVRSGTSVSFQLLTARTAGSAPGDTGTALRAARHRWEDRLLAWAAHPEAGLESPGPARAVAAAQPVAEPLTDPVADLQPGRVYRDQSVPSDTAARLAALERHSVATSSELIELRAQLRDVHEAHRESRRDVKRLRRRVDRLEDETSRLRQELAVAAQRATVAEIGLAALTSTITGAAPGAATASPVSAVTRTRTVVSTPAPARIAAGPTGGSLRALERIRAWCDNRLTQADGLDRR